MIEIFMETVNRIEAELLQEYWPGAIAWADREFNQGWSNAINTFENAITHAARSKDLIRFAEDACVYKKQIVGFLEKYKAHKNMDSRLSFLKTLQRP